MNAREILIYEHAYEAAPGRGRMVLGGPVDTLYEILGKGSDGLVDRGGGPVRREA